MKRRAKDDKRPIYPKSQGELIAELKLLAAEIRAGSATARDILNSRVAQYADYEQRARKILRRLLPIRRRGKFARPSDAAFTVGSFPYRN